MRLPCIRTPSEVAFSWPCPIHYAVFAMRYAAHMRCLTDSLSHNAEPMNLPRRVTQSARLRDQVYHMLREDLQNGTFAAGQRMVEVELASQYGVSRTPVREALFQLAREGLLEDSERGYSLPVDTKDDFLDRLAVRLAVDPLLAAHAALRGTPEHKEILAAHYGKMLRTHAGNKHASFSDAAHQFRLTQIEMSRNPTLIHVCRVLEDHFLTLRNQQYRDKENREIALDFDGKMLNAIDASDSKTASEVAIEYMKALVKRFGGDVAPDTVPWVPLHGTEQASG